MTQPAIDSTGATSAPCRLWNARSLALIVLAWLVLQVGGLFTPGLLDDVDSVYIQIAREMLGRHDFVTPTIDGIRFFDKPPLLYWLAAGSMHLFGIHDWAARLPLALGVLALFFAVYALGLRLYRDVSPQAHPDRAALYAALATATSLGPYLYTRFFIPDILIALWMTLSVHLFLSARDGARIRAACEQRGRVDSTGYIQRITSHFGFDMPMRWAGLLPTLGFGIVMALDVLTKGFIGLVFPLAFVLLFLLIRRELPLLRKLHILPAAIAFLVVAAPWHVLAALRNPATSMPARLGLPAHAGWAWFYLYNEHIARFLGRRIPHDYGQVPIPLFWLLLAIWLLPWAAFLPSALRNAFAALRSSRSAARQQPLRKTPPSNLSSSPEALHSNLSSSPEALPSNLAFRPQALPSDLSSRPQALPPNLSSRPQAEDRSGETPVLRDASAEGTSESAADAALATLLWAGIILGFFTLSSRQEYYHLPAIPALALLVGALLALADGHTNQAGPADPVTAQARKQTLIGSTFFLVPFGLLLSALCSYFALTAHTPSPGADLYSALNNDPAHYNLSLGHIFDLTGTAMGFFRGPLLAVALGMFVLGPVSHLLRRRLHTYAANLAVAAGMVAVLLAAHAGLVRFYPILGSKGLALTIDRAKQPGDLIAIDGELTSGSTLLFYTGQPVLLVNGRVNGPWFGSFWPDAPHIFLDDDALHALWSGPHRVFLLTYDPHKRSADLAPFAPVDTLATSGGKTILSNRP